ncbi:MAG: hypothetical protein ABIG44_00425 [Planctomycetota bacterium]
MMSMLLLLPLTFLIACASHDGLGPQAQLVPQERRGESKDARSTEKDDFQRSWAAIKAGAPETNPPSQVSVSFSIESEDPTAKALLSSFVKRELRSMKHVRIVPDQQNAHCIIHIKAIVFRPEEADALYFLSFVVTVRYTVTDNGIWVSGNVPLPLSEKDAESAEFSAIAHRVRNACMTYIGLCHSTIYVTVIHDAVVVIESELKESMELKLAIWDSQVFEPTVQNIRGMQYFLSELEKASDMLEKELKKRNREGQEEENNLGQSERQPSHKP